MTLLLHYNFFGDQAKDLAQSHDGTWTGTEKYVVGIQDMILRAASFDGASRVNVGGAESDFDFTPTDPFTWSFFFKTPATFGTEQTLLAKGLGPTSGPGFYVSLLTGGSIRFRIRNTIPTNFGPTSAVLTVSTWYHVMGAMSSSGAMSIFINGVASGTGTGVTGTITNNESVAYGADSDGSLPFTGPLTEAKIWDAQLVVANALQLFHEGTNRYDFTSWDGDDT